MRYSLSDPNNYPPFVRDKVNAANELVERSKDWFIQQPLWKRVLIYVCLVIGFIAGLLVLIFHKRLIKMLVVLSDKWHELPYGGLLLFAMVFFVGFPPLLGFSAFSMLAGMVYGFPNGWFLLASASVTGSFASFLVFRYLLNSQAQHLFNASDKFRALAEILRERESSLYLLILIRMCPLPYSLSNGALASVPELSATTFLMASVITSPKLMIHIFVGHKLKELGDETKSTHTKVVDVISILLTAGAAVTTTYVIYAKMQKKLESYNRQAPLDTDVYGRFDDDVELRVTE